MRHTTYSARRQLSNSCAPSPTFATGCLCHAGDRYVEASAARLGAHQDTSWRRRAPAPAASQLPYAHTLVWCRPNCGGAWPGGARRRRALVDMVTWRRAHVDVRGNRQILLPPQAAAYATSRSHLKVYCTKSKPTSRRHATPSVTLRYLLQ